MFREPVRIGIGSKPQGWDLADYVLSRPSGEEREKIDDAIRNAAEAIALIVDGDLETAMNRFNRKPKD